MTSVSRTFGTAKEGLTRFLKPESPCYTAFVDDNEDDVDRLFPFSYSSGVLDITYEGNNFQETMVDISGVSPSSETELIYRIIGGPKLVTSLGDNFKTYIRSWRALTIDAGSPIELVEPTQVVRVQEGDYNSVSADSGNSWQITNFKPASDNYITGSTSDLYKTTYIFKTPLTFSIVEDGVKRYITFRTDMDQE
jgi:hypothetical protein